MNKYALGLHTTSPELGLAVSNFAGDSRYSTWDLGRSLSSHLHQHLNDFIKPQTWADLAFVAVANGPGGYTSTRIGVVTARTLAQQLDVPLFGISTLAALAWSEVEGFGDRAIAVQMDAKRGHVFAAIYQNQSGLVQLLPDLLLTCEVWQQKLESWPDPYHLLQAPTVLGSSVSSVLDLAYLDWQQGKRPGWFEVLPFYGEYAVE